ncbi:MAG: small basic protein [Phycisphaerae bacterium]|nr:small basic protein [Phycisphaerae bacterium]MDD5381324.1 small basic protein [Phycisphaerae bacterium]
MSVDRSLKIKGALERHRNVLTRAERVGKLKDEERWLEGQSVFGLPKIAHRKSHAGKKVKEEAAAVEGAVAGAAPEAPAAAGAKPAAGAAPAGAKPAAAAPSKEKPKGKGKEKG